jgi:hypothetical protein
MMVNLDFSVPEPRAGARFIVDERGGSPRRFRVFDRHRSSTILSTADPRLATRYAEEFEREQRRKEWLRRWIGPFVRLLRRVGLLRGPAMPEPAPQLSEREQKLANLQAIIDRHQG